MPLKQAYQKRQLRRARRNERIVTSVEKAHTYQRPSKYLKLSHNKHTGKKISIHSTSYAALFFLLIITGLVVLLSLQKFAGAGPPIIDSGNINLSGTVFGTPPSTAAVIEAPADQSHISTSTTEVIGACEADYIIEIYRNNSFAGSAICSSGGQFSLTITLVPGENVLLARTTDFQGQYGPDSLPVTVFYDIPKSSTSGSGGGSGAAVLPLLIFTKSVQTGAQADSVMTIKYTISGGVGPYAVAIKWGDGQEDLIPINQDGDYTAAHIYKAGGQFVASLAVQDSRHNAGYIQTIVIVNGNPERSSLAVPVTFVSGLCSTDQGLNFVGSGPAGKLSLGQKISCSIANNVDLIWPIFIVAFIMTFSFWVGEKVVLHKYKRLIQNAKA